MSPHHHKFYLPSKRTRKEIFKDLMRYRTTEDQGLTLKQIFCEVYSDFIEKHATDGQIYSDYRYDPLYRAKVSYLKKIIKQVKKTDDDFRWLSVLPVKKISEEVDHPITITTRNNKINSYIEYIYINVKASKTELLEHINEIWRKRMLKQAKTYTKRANLLESVFEQMEREEKEEEEKRKAELLKWKEEITDR
jgi:hypothetical protein